MILVDANLLLYAYHPKAEQHQSGRAWLETTLSGPELVRFAWLTLWAFLRISTNPRVFERPLSVSEAEAAVSAWLAQPGTGILEPGERYWDILRNLMRQGQTAGPLIMDAALAALAIEHGATLQTTDRDFSRFPRAVRDSQNRSVLGWVRVGTAFTFALDVVNLSLAELGALLWILRPDDGFFHRLGGGKPLGFGSVQLELQGAGQKRSFGLGEVRLWVPTADA